MNSGTTTVTKMIVLLTDNSQSAIPHLDVTRKTTAHIYSLLTGTVEVSLYLLGTPSPVSLQKLEAVDRPSSHQSRTTPCSLIGPILEKLVRNTQKFSVIIVGNGEIFDLADWLDEPKIEGWLLVCTGPESLQGASPRLPEIHPDAVGDLTSLLSHISLSTEQTPVTPTPEYDQEDYQWEVDATGYPLIWIEPLRCFMHLFPVSRPQYERYMAANLHLGYDDRYYQEILQLRSRASCFSRESAPFGQLLMTGVTIEEALSFGKWLGQDFTRFSAVDWQICYDWLAKRAAPLFSTGLKSRLSRDAWALWEIIERRHKGLSSSEFTIYQADGGMSYWERPEDRPQYLSLADLSLHNGGILEWVTERPGSYCGLGDPQNQEYMRRPSDPLYPQESRLKDLGFRLCRRIRS